MHVLFTTAELTPVHRVGGLAEASAGLVKQLRADGVNVTLVVPDYDQRPLRDELVIELDTAMGPARFRSGYLDEVGEITLVESPGIVRPHPYTDADGSGWPDNDSRFLALSAAIAALIDSVRPDVVHLNDWHTAATLAFLDPTPPTVLTIHTLGYQGRTGPQLLDFMPHHRDQFEWFGDTNPLLGAIRLADCIVTVSPHYAEQIRQEPEGMGLAHELRLRADALRGILNGIDTSIWNPDTDPHIAGQFSVDDLSGRAACRDRLLTRAGWPPDDNPLIVMVTRLVDQKGVDLVLDTSRFMAGLGARLMVLGAGARGLTEGLTGAALANPDRVWFRDGYDLQLSHELFAGGDLFVMPSRFEPCGLAQMQAMAYGTIPVVTDVGGLHDTVIDADQDRSRGTGFVAARVDSAALVDALHRAVRAWRHPRRRQAIQRRGMATDWSWAEPAAQHQRIYEALSSGSRTS